MQEETVMSYNNETATLGDRIEAARAAKDMSRDELAKRLGVKKSTIKKWENDQSEPRSNRLYMMGGVLDCNVMWLLNGEGESPQMLGETAADMDRAQIRAELTELRRKLDTVAKNIRILEEKI